MAIRPELSCAARRPSLLVGQKRIKERLWQLFFSDPSQWWDHRSDKTNPHYPDFKHKKTQEALWVDGRLNPQWVKAELAAMAPGTVQRNVASWNIIIAKCVKDGQDEKALEIFQQMLREGIDPNTFSFVPVLNACASLGDLEVGRLIHAQVVDKSLEVDTFVGSTLVDMYAKCGSLEEAWRQFDKMPTRDVVTWNTMIGGFVKCGEGQKALTLFHQMKDQEVEADPVTFVTVINACAMLVALEEGRRVHAQIIQNDCMSDVFVGSSLIDMYAKCGSVEEAEKVFNSMPTRNVVSWSSMIRALGTHGLGQEALKLFKHMQGDEIEPNDVTFVGVLNACASIAALEEGQCVHKKIIQSGWESNVFVACSLVNMYAKCGAIEDAQTVFNKMPRRNVPSWNAMLGGYAMHGLAKEALVLFEQMSREGIEMDSVTFICLLSACSHAGLVDKGLEYFESMSKVYGISATVEHYTCIVDLLSRAGYLNQAEDLIKAMPCEPNVNVWKALLGACRVHGNLEWESALRKRFLNWTLANSSGAERGE